MNILILILYLSNPETACTKKQSVAECEKCIRSDQCIKGFCCKKHRVCVQDNQIECKTISAKCSNDCSDKVPQDSCSCENKDFPIQWPKPTCQDQGVLIIFYQIQFFNLPSFTGGCGSGSGRGLVSLS